MFSHAKERRVHPAFFHCMRAARVELAAGAVVGLLGFRGLELRFSPPAVDVRPGNRIDEEAGVGVAGIGDDAVRVTCLHNRAAVEHDDGPRDVVGGGQIMRDVENGDSMILLEPAESLQDAGAKRGVHHGNRLVGNEESGLQDERACYVDTLALAPGKLMGKSTQHFLRVQADGGEGFNHPVSRIPSGFRQPEPADRDRQQVIHRVEGIEHRKRILEYRLNFPAEGDALLAAEPADPLFGNHESAKIELNRIENVELKAAAAILIDHQFSSVEDCAFLKLLRVRS